MKSPAQWQQRAVAGGIHIGAAWGGLILALGASVFGLLVSALIDGGSAALAFSVLAPLPALAIFRGVAWVVVASTLGQAGLGLFMAADSGPTFAVAITALYTATTLAVLAGAHISFLGRRDTQFAEELLRRYLRLTAVAAGAGILLSSSIYFVAFSAVWPPWLFPITLVVLAAAIAFLARQVNRHRPATSELAR